MSYEDPVDVLLTIREEQGLEHVSETLVKRCYQVEVDHQYDEDSSKRLKLLKELIEEEIIPLGV